MDRNSARATVRISPTRLAQPVLERFSRRLRAARVEAGLSQRALGQRAYMREEFVYRMERGTENPSLATIALLAHALGCQVADFFPHDGASPPDRSRKKRPEGVE